MNKDKYSKKKLVFVNAIGTVGYITQLFAYSLAVIVLLLLFSRTDTGTIFVIEKSGLSEHQAVETFGGTYVEAFGYFTATVFSIITILIILTLPYFIGRYSASAVRWFEKFLKLERTTRSFVITKFSLSFVPLLVFVFTGLYLESPSSLFLVLDLTVIILSGLGIVTVLIQTLLARKLGVKVDRLW